MDSAPNWEVYRDALVPIENKPPPRPWERAPVSAHVPRLHGRQIWKKAGIRPRHNKENDPSQFELESEGAGARKRMRSTSGKGDIGDALWANSGTSTEIDSDDIEGDRKGINEREQSALQFVPRKRTNMDRVITPRKPMRQTTLNGQAQTLVPLNDGDDTIGKPERRRSMRKSLRKSMVPISELESVLPMFLDAAPLKGHDNCHNEFQQSPNIETQSKQKSKPASRRSLTRSIVAVSEPASALPRAHEAAPVETLDEGHKEHQQPTIEPAYIHEKSQRASRRGLRKSIVTVSEQKSSPAVVQEAAPLSMNRDDSHADHQQPAPELLQLTSRRSSRSSAIKEDLQPELEVLAHKPIETCSNLEEIETDESLAQEIPEQMKNSKEEVQPPILRSHVSDIVDSITSNDTVQAPPASSPCRTHEVIRFSLNTPEDQTPDAQSDEVQQTILPSIELDELTMPLKPTGTPKKRKGTGTRRGTRRSTRTRTSSAKAEEDSAQETAVSADIQRISGAQYTTQSPREVPEPLCDEGAVSESTADVQQAVDVVPLNEGNHVDTVEELSIPDPAQDVAPDVKIDSFDLDDARQSHSPIKVNAAEITLDIHEFDLGASVPTRSAHDPAPNNPQRSPAVERVHILLGNMPFIQPNSPSTDNPSKHPPPLQLSPVSERDASPALFDDQTIDILEILEPIFVPADQTLSFKKSYSFAEDLPETSIPDPKTSDYFEGISENAPMVTYDELDDTNMLRNFVTRVKADKAAKAAIPKRKRSLPHSPLQLPLGEIAPAMSPPREKDELDITLPAQSPSKRPKRSNPLTKVEAATEPKSIRRSGRTRLPVVKQPVAGPSFIPVRRLGKDADASVTLRRSAEKELAALTKVNTRKNRGAAVAAELLIRRAEEKEDPACRQRLLKEVFDEKEKRNKKEKKGKGVKWKEDIAEYQSSDGKKSEIEKEESGGAVRVGVRNKIAVAGTPIAKRKTREKS